MYGSTFGKEKTAFSKEMSEKKIAEQASKQEHATCEVRSGEFLRANLKASLNMVSKRVLFSFIML